MVAPKLRFKADNGREFPEWEEKKIGDLIEIYDEKANEDCTLPILTSSKKYGIQYQNDHFGRKQIHDISGYNVLPYGYCTYRNRSDGTDFTFNINTLCKKGIVSKFYPVFTSKIIDLYVLATLLNNEKKTVKRIAYTAKGTGQKVLSISDLQKINVKIPSFPEQQKIATFLSTIDEIIATTEAEVSAWEERKKGVMQKLFRQEVRFKADDGSDFPEWEEKKIGDFLQESRIPGHTGKEAKKLTVKLWAKGVVPKESYLEGSEGTQYYIRHAGQLIYGKLDFLNCAFGIVPKELDGYESTIDSPAFDIHGISSEYLLSYITRREFYKKNGDLANGSRKAKRIQPDVFFDMDINVPCIDEQQKISDCLSSLDDVINQTKAELAAWQEFKKGLLQQMFV